MSEREELLKLKNTTVNLIELLVQQGVLDKDKAQKLIKEAESKAAEEAKKQVAEESVKPLPDEKGVVRVTYIPDFVKDEIRNKVRAELRDEVVREVKANAKEEKWGVPGALPDWLNRIKIGGDIRLRIDERFFPDENQPESYRDWLAINRAGGIGRAADPRTEFRDTTIDRERFRARLRLTVDGQVSEDVKAGIRLSTSNDRNPVSINQTLGQTGQQYEFVVDRVFLQYDFKDSRGFDWITLSGGRFANPWLSTDNVYDPDLNFEGFVGTFRVPLVRDAYVASNLPSNQIVNWPSFHPSSIYFTLGAFPLQEVELSARDKIMLGGQLGLDWLFGDESRLKLAAAYYDYKNVQAKRNPIDSREFDFTAPQFIQQGNSIARISNATGETDATARLVGLASDFNVFNLVASLDFAQFSPVHVLLTADYAKNFGFDGSSIRNKFTSLLDGAIDFRPRTDAFQVRLDVGSLNTMRANEWSAFIAYKYLERDAVLDAFTDSNFHLGGTNAKGWVVGGNYGLARQTWLTARWFSSDVIDGPQYGSDILYVDLTSRF